MSGWIDIKVMQALSQHSVASLGALLSFRLVGWVAELMISDEWLRAFLHLAEQVVLIGLVFYLVARLASHLLKTGE